MKIVRAVTAIALTLTAAKAADLTRTGPLAPSTALIAARKTITEPALELTYRMEQSGKTEAIVVDLAEVFTLITNGTHIFVYDYALKRVIDFDDASHRMRNDSLYATVDFPVSETANRRMQRGLLTTLHINSQVKALAPFWVQSELHVMDKEDGAPLLARRVDADGTVHFSLDSAEVASYAPSKQVLDKDEASRLARFLYARSPLHPLIIADIVASGRLPERIVYVSWAGGKEMHGVWTLQSSVAVKAVYPLMASARPPVPDIAMLPEPALLAVIQAPPPAHSLEHYRAAIESALASQHPFQALLFVFEMREQYGEQAGNCAGAQGCPLLPEIGAAARSDPRTQALVSALEPSKANLAAAIETLKTMKRDDLANAYVLDDFCGNLLVTAHRGDEALPLLAAAIKGNPAMPGFYNDMGDAYRSRFDSVSAWYFYDLGRALPGGANAPVISKITKYEAWLETLHPEFF